MASSGSREGRHSLSGSGPFHLACRTATHQLPGCTRLPDTVAAPPPGTVRMSGAVGSKVSRPQASGGEIPPREVRECPGSPRQGTEGRSCAISVPVDSPALRVLTVQLGQRQGAGAPPGGLALVGRVWSLWPRSPAAARVVVGGRGPLSAMARDGV